jgi:hypothetical protein
VGRFARGQRLGAGAGARGLRGSKSRGGVSRVVRTGPAELAVGDKDDGLTRNLYLELWSKNLDDRLSHVERGSTPGYSSCAAPT